MGYGRTQSVSRSETTINRLFPQPINGADCIELAIKGYKSRILLKNSRFPQRAQV
jgi:hypothetical protein